MTIGNINKTINPVSFYPLASRNFGIPPRGKEPSTGGFISPLGKEERGLMRKKIQIKL
ncbi:MAG: hypothetical protein RBS38_15840 [Bacteroidales bacterium]|jgi:hypothetical protein|nr:hypothetical protein [Bacteroidales bacterium]